MKFLRAAALAIPAALLAPASDADMLQLDGVAAIVDENVILRSDLDLATDLLARRVRSRGAEIGPEQLVELRTEALRGLIDDQLIQALAERNDAAATDEEIDRTIQGIAAEEGVGPEDVYRAAASQGLPRRAYRKQLGMQLTRMRVVSGSVRSRITVTDAEVKELFDERFGRVAPGLRVRALHILLALPPDAGEDVWESARGLAEQARRQALESGQFATIARRISSAPTAPQGGLTVFREGDAPPQVETALEALVPGEITPVIRTEHGLNLFQLLDRFDPADVKLEDIADQLRAELEERQVEPEFEKFLAEVRKSRYIEIVNPNPR